MANPTSLAIHEFQALITTAKEHNSLSVNPIGQNKFELVRLPKASSIQPELFTFMLVEGDRIYHIRIAGRHDHDDNKHVIAKEGGPTRWLVTSHEQRAYSIQKENSNMVWTCDSRGRIELNETGQHPSNEQLFKFAI